MLAVVEFFVGLIEIIGELAKVISLSLRLFGNMFAHEVLMIILLGSLSVGIPAVWMGMGILVGIVQAIVFMALITVYYSLLVMTDKGH
jgi:F-type H+-transporting ATPase subunit a